MSMMDDDNDDDDDEYRLQVYNDNQDMGINWKSASSVVGIFHAYQRSLKDMKIVKSELAISEQRCRDLLRLQEEFKESELNSNARYECEIEYYKTTVDKLEYEIELLKSENQQLTSTQSLSSQRQQKATDNYQILHEKNIRNEQIIANLKARIDGLLDLSKDIHIHQHRADLELSRDCSLDEKCEVFQQNYMQDITTWRDTNTKLVEFENFKAHVQNNVARILLRCLHRVFKSRIKAVWNQWIMFTSIHRHYSETGNRLRTMQQTIETHIKQRETLSTKLYNVELNLNNAEQSIGIMKSQRIVILARVFKRIQTHFMNLSWKRWRNYYTFERQHARHNKKIQTMAKARNQRLIERVFARWHQTVVVHRQMKMRIIKLQARMAIKRKEDVFDIWVQRYENHRARLAHLVHIMNHRARSQLTTAMNRWVNFVQNTRNDEYTYSIKISKIQDSKHVITKAKNIISTMCKRDYRRALRRAFDDLFQHTQASKCALARRERCIHDRHLVSIQKRAFNIWAGNLQKRRHYHHQLHYFQSRTLKRVFRAWAFFARIRQQQESMMHLFGETLMANVLWWRFLQWRSFVDTQIMLRNEVLPTTATLEGVIVEHSRIKIVYMMLLSFRWRHGASRFGTLSGTPVVLFDHLKLLVGKYVSLKGTFQARLTRLERYFLLMNQKRTMLNHLQRWKMTHRHEMQIQECARKSLVFQVFSELKRFAKDCRDRKMMASCVGMSRGNLIEIGYSGHIYNATLTRLSENRKHAYIAKCFHLWGALVQKRKTLRKGLFLFRRVRNRVIIEAARDVWRKWLTKCKIRQRDVTTQICDFNGYIDRLDFCNRMDQLSKIHLTAIDTHLTRKAFHQWSAFRVKSKAGRQAMARGMQHKRRGDMIRVIRRLSEFARRKKYFFELLCIGIHACTHHAVEEMFQKWNAATISEKVNEDISVLRCSRQWEALSSVDIKKNILESLTLAGKSQEQRSRDAFKVWRCYVGKKKSRQIACAKIATFLKKFERRTLRSSFLTIIIFGLDRVRSIQTMEKSNEILNMYERSFSTLIHPLLSCIWQFVAENLKTTEYLTASEFDSSMTSRDTPCDFWGGVNMCCHTATTNLHLFDFCEVLRIDEDALSYLDEFGRIQQQIPLDESISYHVTQSGLPAIIPDTDLDDRYNADVDYPCGMQMAKQWSFEHSARSLRNHLTPHEEKTPRFTLICLPIIDPRNGVAVGILRAANELSDEDTPGIEMHMAFQLLAMVAEITGMCATAEVMLRPLVDTCDTLHRASSMWKSSELELKRQNDSLVSREEQLMDEMSQLKKEKIDLERRANQAREIETQVEKVLKQYDSSINLSSLKQPHRTQKYDSIELNYYSRNQHK